MSIKFYISEGAEPSKYTGIEVIRIGGAIKSS